MDRHECLPYGLKANDGNFEMISNLPGQSETKSCSRCQANFSCGAQSAKGDCWCNDLPRVGPFGAEDQDCLCPECLRLSIEAVTESQPEVKAPARIVEKA
jgi:hypothetical protein